jgi:hypothetical protein
MSVFKPCPPDEGRARCGNCSEEFAAEEAGWISSAHERLDAGEEIPVGECPECGCCAYVIKPRNCMKDQDLKDTITEFFNDHDKVCLNTIQDALVLLIVEVMGSAPDCGDKSNTVEPTIAEECKRLGEDRPEHEASDIEPGADVPLGTAVVRVIPKIPFGLHELDEGVQGEYVFTVIPGDQAHKSALDQFHNSVPIKVLDDFNITVTVGKIEVSYIGWDRGVSAGDFGPEGQL